MILCGPLWSSFAASQERNGSFGLYFRSQLSSEEIKAGAEPEATEELYSLSGFLAHAQLGFLYNLGPPV